ncbi:SRPBCC family protein [Kribbella sp. NPDC004875]|uniref:SRPBCC family protein n=1 Tax=Kribbella sp. NPDC004875 TaxID=3364107 RepID=UPI0036A5B9A3
MTSKILGRLGVTDGRGVVRIEDRYDTGIDDLWSAMTDPERLARWYGKVQGDLRPGGTFTEYIESAEVEAVGRIEICEPPHRLRVTSRESDDSAARGTGPAPADHLIEATLTPDGTQTVLTIEVHGLPVDKLEYYGAGWQVHAETLAAYLANRAPADPETRWSVLVPAYQEQAAVLR